MNNLNSVSISQMKKQITNILQILNTTNNSIQRSAEVSKLFVELNLIQDKEINNINHKLDWIIPMMIAMFFCIMIIAFKQGQYQRKYKKE